MRHRIDPTVDYAFKCLLATDENTDLLLHFLNAVLGLAVAIVSVRLQSPFVPAQYRDDDVTIVDVMATDALGRVFQIEVQGSVRPDLAARVLYTWADLYQAQIERGEAWTKLRPVTAIWVLGESMFPRCLSWKHDFRPRGTCGCSLTDHFRVQTLELAKWRAPSGPLDAGNQWAYFLSQAGTWDVLPDAPWAPELRKAMSILDRISSKQEDLHRYRRSKYLSIERATIAEDQVALVETRRELAEARRALSETVGALADNQAALAEKQSALAEKDEALAEKQSALAEKQSALAEKDEALAEKDEALAEKQSALAERDTALAALRDRLRAAGLDPDA